MDMSDGFLDASHATRGRMWKADGDAWCSRQDEEKSEKSSQDRAGLLGMSHFLPHGSLP